MQFNTNKQLICVSTDEVYIHYLVSFLRSIQRFNSNYTIFCRLVNVISRPPDYKNVEYIIDNTKLSTERKFIKNQGGAHSHTFSADLKTPTGIRNTASLMYSEQAAYTCHSRFKNIIHLLDSDCDNILSLDVDTIVRRDISELFKQVDFDIGVISENLSGEEHLFMNEGLILLNNTRRTRSFFTDVHDVIFSDDTFTDWDADSRALQSVYDRSSLRVKTLPKSYKCKQHLQDSHMWSGDGVNKDKLSFTNEINNIG